MHTLNFRFYFLVACGLLAIYSNRCWGDEYLDADASQVSISREAKKFSADEIIVKVPGHEWRFSFDSGKRCTDTLGKDIWCEAFQLPDGSKFNESSASGYAYLLQLQKIAAESQGKKILRFHIKNMDHLPEAKLTLLEFYDNGTNPYMSVKELTQMDSKAQLADLKKKLADLERQAADVKAQIESLETKK